ncbi:MAG TPA: Flp family type IVb pilin [Sphingobium sp.]|nr:Flp family type IVb pilin [Sphingobium sp.]
MRARFHKISACQRGATAVEYGLIIALIVLAIIGAMNEFASKTNGMWNHISNEVTNR